MKDTFALFLLVFLIHLFGNATGFDTSIGLSILISLIIIGMVSGIKKALNHFRGKEENNKKGGIL